MKIVKVELVVEKTIKEQLDEATKTGHGVIIPTFNLSSGTMNNEKDNSFDISMGGGSKIFFTFKKEKRRVHFDLAPLITAAYEEAIKE